MSTCVSDTDCIAPTPYCSAEHICVGCLHSDQCPSTAPVCDMTSQTCRSCAADSECPSSVCDVDAGTCVSASSVLYAAPSGADTATCSNSNPCSITHAFAVADTTHDTIKLAAGNYSANLVVTGKRLLVAGDGAARPAVVGG